MCLRKSSPNKTRIVFFDSDNIEDHALMSKRYIILHCHIFKNAGSTIDNILKNNFGASAIIQESNDGQFISPDNLIAIAKEGNINAISSHKLGLPVPIHSAIEFIPLIMLREPLDRLGSMYSFYNRQKQKINHECILAQQTSFKDFVEILLENGLDKSFVNIQAQFFLANCTPAKYPSEKTWEILVKNFNNVRCVGVLERFDDSLTLWEKYLQFYFPAISCVYTKKNVSGDREKDISVRLLKIKDELGTELVAEFEKRNKIDYRLYHLANKRLDAEINNSPEFRIKKKNFAHIIKALEQVCIPQKKVDDTVLPFAVEKKISIEKPIYIQTGKYKFVEISLEKDVIPSKSIHIVGCGLFDYATKESLIVVRHGQKIQIILLIKANEQINQPIVGITIKNGIHDIMFEMNSFFNKEKLDSPEIGIPYSYSFIFKMPVLNSGIYSITPAFVSGSQNDNVPLSCINDAIVFIVPAMISQRLPGAMYVKNFKLKAQQL